MFDHNNENMQKTFKLLWSQTDYRKREIRMKNWWIFIFTLNLIFVFGVELKERNLNELLIDNIVEDVHVGIVKIVYFSVIAAFFLCGVAFRLCR